MLIYILIGIFAACLIIPTIWLQLTDKEETDQEKEEFKQRVYKRKRDRIRSIVEDLLRQTHDNQKIIEYIEDKNLKDIFTTEEIQSIIVEIKKERQIIPMNIEKSSSEAID